MGSGKGQAKRINIFGSTPKMIDHKKIIEFFENIDKDHSYENSELEKLYNFPKGLFRPDKYSSKGIIYVDRDKFSELFNGKDVNVLNNWNNLMTRIDDAGISFNISGSSPLDPPIDIKISGDVKGDYLSLNNCKISWANIQSHKKDLDLLINNSSLRNISESSIGILQISNSTLIDTKWRSIDLKLLEVKGSDNNFQRNYEYSSHDISIRKNSLKNTVIKGAHTKRMSMYENNFTGQFILEDGKIKDFISNKNSFQDLCVKNINVEEMVINQQDYLRDKNKYNDKVSGKISIDYNTLAKEVDLTSSDLLFINILKNNSIDNPKKINISENDIEINPSDYVF